MTTRNGQQVKNVTRVGSKLIGFIKGQPYSWQLNGRRSENHRSKLDLVLEKTRYIVIRNRAGKLSARLYDEKPNGRSIVKVIEVTL
jgi:hypothetical protein